MDYFDSTPEKVLYCFPKDEDVLLTDYLTYRILADELDSPNLGRYLFIPNILYNEYYIFETAATPTTFDDHIQIITLLSQTTIIVSPSILLPEEEEAVDSVIYIYNDEEKIHSLSLTDLTGLASFSGLTMEFTISDSKQVQLAFVDNLTSITTALLVTIPPIPFQDCYSCPLTWSLRVTGTEEVLGSGLIVQTYAPLGV